MPLAETLQRVNYDISQGNLEKARDRLTGMLWKRAYPNNLSIRKKLGDIYFLLHNTIEAGRFWYLEEIKTPEMEYACRRFEKSCGNDAFQIGCRLKFQGDLRTIRSKSVYAANVLSTLQIQANSQRGEVKSRKTLWVFEELPRMKDFVVNWDS